MRLPREHGAWAMLYVPFVLGALAGARAAALVPLALLCVAATALFVAREEMLALWRARRHGAGPISVRVLALEIAAALVSAIVLIHFYRTLALLPLAVLGLLFFVVHFLQTTQRAGRTISGELLAIIGLTMTAPAAWFVAIGASELVPRGDTLGVALWLWFLCALYFASSIFHVKLRVLDLQPRKARARDAMRRWSAGYHIALAALLIGCVATRQLHAWTLVAFAAIIVRASWSILRPTRRLDLRRAGLQEVAYSLLFLAGAALAFRT